MRPAVLLVLLTLPARADLAPRPQTGGWGAALVALTVWSGAEIGLPHPQFVLYDSGRVIFRNGRGDWRTAKLTPAERAKLLDGLSFDHLGDLNSPEVRGLDGAWSCVHVRSTSGPQRECVWGSLDGAPALASIWRRLASFSSPRATTWAPLKGAPGKQTFPDERMWNPNVKP
jgi:hypothetical protein